MNDYSYYIKMTWNPLQKKPFLCVKPGLSQGLSNHMEDRELEMCYNNLQNLEENCKKLYKEVKRYEECISNLLKLEQNMSSELSNSPLVQDHVNLRRVAENYQSVTYQMGHNTDDLVQLSQKTVFDPLKKLNPEFGAIAAALKRRDTALSEAIKAKSKWEKAEKLEKTGANVARADHVKKAWLSARDEYETQNKLLLLELPQFYDKRIDYFQPCLQALVRSQVNFYGETNGLYTQLVSATADQYELNGSESQNQDAKDKNCGQVPKIKSDKEFQDDLEKQLLALRSLSIVGK